jgi:hypothetical protein
MELACSDSAMFTVPEALAAYLHKVERDTEKWILQQKGRDKNS